MLGVLVGFSVIAVMIAAGWVVGRTGVLGEGARYVLARLAFFVLTPSLLFTVLADADIAQVFSAPLAIAAIAFVAATGAFSVISAFAWRRSPGERVIGALTAGYINAGNFGIPVSLYVLGDAALSAPIILLQLSLITPIIVTVLDRIERGRAGVLASLTGPFRNPIVIGVIVGLVVALSGIEIPEPVMSPFRMMGAASVPVMLVAFGMGMVEKRAKDSPGRRGDLVLATVIKLGLMPLVAWVLATFVFRLDQAGVFAVVILAALPVAQNIFTYAQRYRLAESLARDAVLVQTFASVPVMLLIAALLAPR